MPKNPSILLKEELLKNQFELLDIYRFKDHDLIRVKNILSNKVFLVKVSKHVTDIVSQEDLKDVVKKILDEVKAVEESR